MCPVPVSCTEGLWLQDRLWSIHRLLGQRQDRGAQHLLHGDPGISEHGAGGQPCEAHSEWALERGKPRTLACFREVCKSSCPGPGVKPIAPAISRADAVFNIRNRLTKHRQMGVGGTGTRGVTQRATAGSSHRPPARAGGPWGQCLFYHLQNLSRWWRDPAVRSQDPDL